MGDSKGCSPMDCECNDHSHHICNSSSKIYNFHP